MYEKKIMGQTTGYVLVFKPNLFPKDVLEGGTAPRGNAKSPTCDFLIIHRHDPSAK